MATFGGARWCCAALAAALSVSGSLGRRFQRVDDRVLRNAAKSGEEWLTTGRDYSETRYSPLKQINATNVGQLGLVWYYDTGAEPGNLEATPIVSNGTLYATLTWSVVFAVDVRTGKLKWRYDPHIGHRNFAPGSQNDPNRVRTGPTICCGPVNRGVTIYDGKVYAGLLDGRLVALDADSGKVVWEVHTTDPNADYGITGAPRIVRGKVIIGNVGGEFAVRGYVSAYDAETGKQVWRFYTVPGDPSKPFESKAMERAAKTWTGEWYKMGGGGTPWDAFAYDPDLNLLYVGTGNGGPWDRNWRSPGGGDNLYTSSIVALRPDTGVLVWYFQETPGDDWDYDATQDMILADLKIGGKVRKVIMQAPKNGFFYVLDRKTGRFLSALPFAYVTWATGIDQETGRPIEAPNARYATNGSVVSPGGGGAHNWQAMSFNPDTGLAYIPGTNSSFFYAEDTSTFQYHVGNFDRGINADPTRPLSAQSRPQAPMPMIKGAPPPPRGSFLLAWDPATGKERWRIAGVGGSTMTTAGNLVFSSSNDGRFIALSADKGEKLWQAQLVPGFGSPVTYMTPDGKQYVSVLAGRIGRGRLYTFALDGNLVIPSSAPAAPAANSNNHD
ncbi:MAG: PQQ-dependent dehydrogenase, methanol/ethanol family [Candidatus Acidiferrales bacterium]